MTGRSLVLLGLARDEAAWSGVMPAVAAKQTDFSCYTYTETHCSEPFSVSLKS